MAQRDDSPDSGGDSDDGGAWANNGSPRNRLQDEPMDTAPTTSYLHDNNGDSSDHEDQGRGDDDEEVTFLSLFVE